LEPGQVAPPPSSIKRIAVLPGEIPFEKWMSEGKREDIRWSVSVSRPRLSVSQRIIVRMTIRVDSKRIQSDGSARDFFVAAGFRMSEAGWHENRGMAAFRLEQSPPKNTYLEISLQAFLLPGDYTLGVLLYDKVQNLRSVDFRRVRVRGIEDDPLPKSFRTLPRVEFIQSERAFFSSEPTEITSRLHLPLGNRRPLRIEVLANYTPSYEFAGRRVPQQLIISLVTAMLRVLSQVEVQNGAVSVTALDLGRRRILFEQRDTRNFDFVGLRTGLATLNPAVVDVKDLQNRLAAGAYFREVLASKLADSAAQNHGGNGSPFLGSAASASEEPFRAIIVVSTPVLFERRTDLAPLVPPADCNCRIYHVRYRLGTQDLWDELSRLVARFRPRRFEVSNPEDFRRALAAIMSDLQKL
jgi:hypothetical protein